MFIVGVMCQSKWNCENENNMKKEKSIKGGSLFKKNTEMSCNFFLNLEIYIFFKF